jgi:cleavage and polyadenylation specificity factor subunit 1
MSLDSPLFRAVLRVDPLSRCAALSLPKDAFAILPFFQTQAELGIVDQDQTQARYDDLFYLLRTKTYLSAGISHTRQVSFLISQSSSIRASGTSSTSFSYPISPNQRLPYYSTPNSPGQGKTSPPLNGGHSLIPTQPRRLKEYKDTAKLVVFTLDIVTQGYSIISSAEGLPYDCLSLLACPAALGGVVVLTCNSIIYVDQASRRVPLPLNGWPARISGMPAPIISPEHQSCIIELEGSCSAFVDDKTIFVILKDGTVYPVDMVIGRKTVSKLNMGSALAQTPDHGLPSFRREHCWSFCAREGCPS